MRPRPRQRRCSLSIARGPGSARGGGGGKHRAAGRRSRAGNGQETCAWPPRPPSRSGGDAPARPAGASAAGRQVGYRGPSILAPLPALKPPPVAPYMYPDPLAAQPARASPISASATRLITRFRRGDARPGHAKPDVQGTLGQPDRFCHGHAPPPPVRMVEPHLGKRRVGRSSHPPAPAGLATDARGTLRRMRAAGNTGAAVPRFGLFWQGNREQNWSRCPPTDDGWRPGRS